MRDSLYPGKVSSEVELFLPPKFAISRNLDYPGFVITRLLCVYIGAKYNLTSALYSMNIGCNNDTVSAGFKDSVVTLTTIEFENEDV